ncbi:MAG: hypothetical protein Q8904_09960 [Bacteroidota bacterium]|nr:hypothetical protein [Bacteroidota bacterium]
MRKIIYYLFQIILVSVIALGSFAIINITDIIKYQTDTESGIPRGDIKYYVCRAIWIGVCILTTLSMIVLRFYKNRILKKRETNKQE